VAGGEGRVLVESAGRGGGGGEGVWEALPSLESAGRGGGGGEGVWEALPSTEELRRGETLLAAVVLGPPPLLLVRLSRPTRRPARLSRASWLWPTSSKDSVASASARSSKTSSPPLLYKRG
jgi:hypothetical protein